MLNRPRPRKIVSVIKSSPSNAEIPEKPEDVELKNFMMEKSLETQSLGTSGFVSSNTNVEEQRSEPRLLNVPVISNISSVKSNETSPSKSEFVIRKPVVATLRKANIPPPPSFSDSPKLNFPVNSSVTANNTFNPMRNPIRTDILSVPKSPTALSTSPKSSGEVFLDAADKAVDLIGGALINSFKSFNLSDEKPVVFDTKKDEDDAFADIMQKLKINNAKSSKEEPDTLFEPKPSISLLDEEPPASFSFAEKVNPMDEFEKKEEKSSLVKPPVKCASQPSSAIQAAFSPQKKHQEPKADYFKDSFDNSKSEVTFNQVDIVSDISKFHIAEEVVKDIIDDNETNFVFEQVDDSTKHDFILDPNVAKNQLSPKSEISSESRDNSFISENSGIIDQSSVSSIPFFDSLKNFGSGNSLETSPSTSIESANSTSSSRHGFRASILKHGLSALEKIGKSTADVVVNTRNKLAEPQMLSTLNPSQPITPDYNDATSSFYDIFKLYGGYAKLQDLQIKGIRASVSMKLSHNNPDVMKTSSYDHNARLRIQREIAQILHPDRIMEAIDDSNSKNLLSNPEIAVFFPELVRFEDELGCIQKLLKTLDNTLIVNDDSIINSSNRRRHIICQISTVYCGLLQQILSQSQEVVSLNLTKEISLLASQIIKYFQTNFARNCEDHTQADRDQQLAIKLILDISYASVPRFQFNIINS